MKAGLPTARERLIVALDVATEAEALGLVERLGDSVMFYKVGLELVFAGGLSLAPRLKERGKAVFLDLKLHDIPNTVERATANIARLGVDILTVHAYPQTMAAAARGKAGSDLKVIGVTVLTSMAQGDAQEAGYSAPIADLVAKRAGQAVASGLDGLVCSPAEANDVRRLIGADRLIVTPGIRPVGAASGDQARIATPGDAIGAGASHLVVGRPITQAGDPRAAAENIVAQIAHAL